ncbi:flagellar hook-basal body complex protein [Hyphomonas johnsonii]|jgi:flagellar basal-body rod protein FlgF|uniref:Flagellar basal-body rod protein FlgF n=1 Tax=Hyphomonas johnsonii MHS-2 TaxID=1280950 RepID=A0A059FNM2_9PROT|nr:flagellar hook-basal body complex protein [Hyphomonas johnsonii]KCZ92222.1 flagellar basal body rod protein FlgF [Hyphomonas johnsonii MHS-2]
MSNAVYASLARQHGLVQEMQVVSNNLANASTTGYKSDRAIFAEFLTGASASGTPLSMGGLAGHAFEMEQGAFKLTGSQFDVAVQGEGYFIVETGQGVRLTRAGHFQMAGDGTLVDMNGSKVLGNGGAPISIPPEASQVSIGSDGTISVDGQEIDRLGVVLPEGDMLRDSNTYFSAPGGYGAATESSVVQGALEQSNVSPVLEVARMIEVQRAYEAGQTLLEREDQRIGQLISTVRER